MKKIVLILAITFAVSGCSQNYLAEREYHKATEISKTVSKEDVEAKGVEILTPVIEAYEAVYDKYPGTYKALESLFIISQLYIQQEKYDEARTALQNVITNFSRNGVKTSEARYAIAKTYDAQGQWGKAERVYWNVAEYNTLEEQGLRAPLEIIGHYKNADYQDAAQRVYKKAVEHYEILIHEIGPIQASIRPSHYLALVHSEMGHWDLAKSIWDNTYSEFFDTDGVGRLLLSAAEAAVNLKAPEKEILAYYEQYITSHKNEGLPAQFSVQVAMHCMEQKAFDLARKWYHHALDGFKNQDNQKADVKILIGRSYQQEGNWPEAQKWYNEILQMHERSLAGLQVPLFIADYYKSIGDDVKMNEALDKAIERYNAVIAEYEGKLIAQLALQFKTTAYKKKENWTQVIKEYDHAISIVENLEQKAQYTFLKAAIVDSKLKDKTQALDLYTDFLTTYPEHPQATFVKKRMEILAQK